VQISVEALRKKLEGRGFYSRWGQNFFIKIRIHSVCNMAVKSTQPLTGVSSRG